MVVHASLWEGRGATAFCMPLRFPLDRSEKRETFTLSRTLSPSAGTVAVPLLLWPLWNSLYPVLDIPDGLWPDNFGGWSWQER